MSKALIQGAAYSAPKFQSYNPFDAKEMKQQALQQVYQDRNVRRYIDQLPQGVELDKVPSSMHGPVKQFLSAKKMQYGQLARQISGSNVPAGSPMYMQIQGEMQKIQGEFKSLSQDLDNFKNYKTEYLQDFDTGGISSGAQDARIKELFGKDDYKVQIVDGKLNFLMDDGSFLAAKDIGSKESYFLKNAEAVDGLLKLNQQAYKNALPIDKTSDYLYRRQVQQLVGGKGREGMLSLATDGFLDAPLINLKNPNDPNLFLLKEENHEQLKSFLVDNWMGGISAAASEAYKMKNRASNMVGSLGNLDYKSIMDIWNTGDLEQLTNMLPLDSKIGIVGYDDGTYDLKMGSRTVRKGIDPGEPQHLNMLLEVLGVPSMGGNSGGGIDINKI